jgi:hypothetical protein
MRELTATEIFGVGGAGGLTFTTALTPSVVNNVANATTVGRMVALSFGVGYAVGSYLNEKFSISTWLVDKLTD